MPFAAAPREHMTCADARRVGIRDALTALLFLLAAVLVAWGSAKTSPSIWAVAVASLGLVLWPRCANRWHATPLAWAVVAYSGWTILHTAFLSKVYNPAGLFDPLFLLGGFAVGRVLEGEQRTQVYRAIGLLLASLSLWAIGQVLLQSSRGHAHFETGSALATNINLILAPAIVALAYGYRSRALLLLAILLFAALCATFSRAAFIALLAGLAITPALVSPAPATGWRRIYSLLAVVVTTSLALYLMAAFWSMPRLPIDASLTSLDSAKARFELYRLAWSASATFFGIGYLGFRHVLEIGRAEVPSYGESSFTYFVHNDYLQTLLELGVPGLLALLAMIVIAVWTVKWRVPDAQKSHSAALVAGVIVLALHAVLDFPLHVPLCLLLLGVGLGAIDRLGSSPTARNAPAGRLQGFTMLALGLALTVCLLRPVAAEAVAAYAMKKWFTGETRDAASAFELARRCDARDFRYHLYAGQFWLARAAEDGEPEHARRADDAFRAGMVANSLEPSAALGRAFTQLRYSSILPAPAPASEVRAWAEQALMVAPLNPTVRKDYQYILGRLAAR